MAEMRHRPSKENIIVCERVAPVAYYDRFAADIKSLLRPSDKCELTSRCMLLDQGGSGSMKFLVIVSYSSETIILLVGMNQNNNDVTDNSDYLLSIEQIIPITADIDINIKKDYKETEKRPSLTEEGEVEVAITRLYKTEILQILLPYSVELLELLQRVKQAVHTAKSIIPHFQWLGYYRQKIEIRKQNLPKADIFPHSYSATHNSTIDIVTDHNSLLLNNTNKSRFIPLIILDDNSTSSSSATPNDRKHSSMNNSHLHIYSHPPAGISRLDYSSGSGEADEDSVDVGIKGKKVISRSDNNLRRKLNRASPKLRRNKNLTPGDKAAFTRNNTHRHTKFYADLIQLDSSDTIELTEYNYPKENNDCSDKIQNYNYKSDVPVSNDGQKKSKSKFYTDLENLLITSEDSNNNKTQMENSAANIPDKSPAKQLMGNIITLITNNTITATPVTTTLTISNINADDVFNNEELEMAGTDSKNRYQHSFKHKVRPLMARIGRGMTESVLPLTAAHNATDTNPDSSAAINTNPIDIQVKGPLELVDTSKKMSPLVRERLVAKKMHTRQAEYTNQQRYWIMVATFNVNSKGPPTDLRSWLASSGEPPNFYAIGFQELDNSAEALVLGTHSKMEAEWQSSVEQCLDSMEKYSLLSSIRMVGVFLLVYCRAELAQSVVDIDSCHQPTGILGMMGNKGGVSIRFKFQETEVCIVNSHLAAHVAEVERRNQDFHDIILKTEFSQLKTPKSILDHDIIIWLGDLNYRLVQTESLTIERMKQMIDDKNFFDLSQSDQLRIEIDKQKVFQDFFEAPLDFKPTYRYDTGTDNWDSSDKQRAPAWCDRVLWRGSHIGLLSYNSDPEIKISDHKPVSAYFEVGVKEINSVDYKKVFEDVCFELDKEENEYLPQIDISTNDQMLKFNEIHFGQPVTQSIVAKNTGKFAVSLYFIPKINEVEISKLWLKVSQESPLIVPGQSTKIHFTILVDEEIAYSLAEERHLEDILILHLDGGKDFFITVTGNYIPSCFGSSLEYLSRTRVPFCQALVPTAILLDLSTDTSLDLSGSSQLQQFATPSSGSNSYSFSSSFSNTANEVHIPREITVMVEYLKENARNVENLFQVRGLKWEMEEIREALDTGSPIRGSIHSVADCLITFLKALQMPVIPFHLHHKIEECFKNFVLCQQIVLKGLPEEHKQVFQYLTRFLSSLNQDTSQNKINSGFLATIFSSAILRPPFSRQRALQNSRENPELVRKKAIFIHQFIMNPI